MPLNSLSGRFAVITGIFVLLAELLILLPSIANYRLDFLESRLERAQIASLALLATDESLAADLESELLENAGVFNVVLRRNDVRQLVLSSPIPGPIAATYDLRDQPFWTSIRDGMAQLADPQNRVIRVIGAPVNQAGQLIEITTDTERLRTEMIDYGLRLLLISAAFSVLTALLLNLAAQRLLLVPIRRVISHMTAYANAPEDARSIITPNARLTELNEAETALAAMQRTVTSALKQKDRLAQLGQAVARISHDLRNILTTAQIFADRLETSADPAVRRAAPKLVNSISRAVNLCETTLAFGKAEEPAPALSRFNLSALVTEVTEGEALASDRPDGAEPIEFLTDIPPSLMIRADRDQLFRVLSNLVRNARQAIEATRRPGTIEIGAGEDEQEWWIRIGDTGPGLPQKARDFLFQPFSGGSRKGGTGLGLAIAADLVRNHGGRLELLRSDEEGTQFILHLPRELAGLAAQVEAAAGQR
ncbi:MULTISPECIES: ATP-binding protein [Paracoccus]|jgi:signal transduction histidine kinase|uniref:histidine kinase n=1 Tax=Paracoccus denitrificans (strain Pd 1222) TaxID=318586 RepID=A1B0D8_PARDP|nr:MULTISPECIES: ATP-binding protein [Paracoccus]ABL68982.1 integral membrane sensor signal transduction histidine kinase [Paracoccus denitrificans PD1222]MBB4625291.1 signal transduction histidine kinase [Paracoccus denitrificans]MCU7428117.1 HAMP domain-containing histidine kinase [Paracoccus denitrificans]MDK8873527.1 ATP-binding protein [Paracoccus sp. SSJ]QAR27020.1 HAMP domain-containing histidine kinase [Paracoccus denitrificans]